MCLWCATKSLWVEEGMKIVLVIFIFYKKKPGRIYLRNRSRFKMSTIDFLNKFHNSKAIIFLLANLKDSSKNNRLSSRPKSHFKTLIVIVNQSPYWVLWFISQASKPFAILLSCLQDSKAYSIQKKTRRSEWKTSYVSFLSYISESHFFTII